MEVIGYMNCCIVEFGRRSGLEPKWACRYLYLHGGLDLLDKNYQGEHLLPLDDTIDLSKCRPNKDFGKGFYLTTIESQAIEMAQRRCNFDESGSQ